MIVVLYAMMISIAVFDIIYLMWTSRMSEAHLNSNILSKKGLTKKEYKKLFDAMDDIVYNSITTKSEIVLTLCLIIAIVTCNYGSYDAYSTASLFFIAHLILVCVEYPIYKSRMRNIRYKLTGRG